jgi:hypothetical protein
MENLHKDVLIELALELNLDDLFNLCQTNKRFNSLLCKNDDFWKQKYITLFGLEYYKKQKKITNHKKEYLNLLLKTNKNIDFINNILPQIEQLNTSSEMMILTRKVFEYFSDKRNKIFTKPMLDKIIEYAKGKELNKIKIIYNIFVLTNIFKEFKLTEKDFYNITK